MQTRFKPVEWMHNTNIYEVNIRQFTAAGTFNAFVRELPRLKDMGVKTLWFMPVTPLHKNKKAHWAVIMPALIIPPSILNLVRLMILKAW